MALHRSVSLSNLWQIKYSNDSYMYHRGGSNRQGFAGNYVRSTSTEGTTQRSDDSPVNSSLVTSSSSSAVSNCPSQLTSVNPPKAETLFKVTSVVTVPGSSARRPEFNTIMETGSKMLHRSNETPPWRSRPRADTVPLDSTQNSHDGHSRMVTAEEQYFSNSLMKKSVEIPINHATPNRTMGDSKEDTESPSVRSVISNFERKRPPPRVAEKPSIARSKVMGMKDNWVSRSNENLVDYNRANSPENLNENSTPKEHVIPVRVAQVSSQYTPGSRTRNGNRSSPLSVRKFSNGIEAPRTTANEQSYNDTPTSSRTIAVDIASDSPMHRKLSGDLVEHGSQFRSHQSNSINTNDSRIINRTSSSEIPVEIVSRKKTSPSEMHTTRRQDSEEVFYPQSSTRGGSPPVSPPSHISITPQGATSNTIVSSITTTPVGTKPCSPVTDGSYHGESDNSINSPGIPSPNEPRRVSQEELDCESQAAIVAKQLHHSDRKLSTVIMPPPQHKTSVDFMAGLFDTAADPNHQPSLLPRHRERKTPIARQDSSTGDSSCWSSPSFSPCQNRSFGEDSMTDTLTRQKDELGMRIDRKMAFMCEERDRIQEEIEQNNELGKEVTVVVERKLTHRAELEKYQLYVGEIDMVIALLLKVSGRLARAENALLSLTDDASEKQRAALMAKRDEIMQKHEDARLLKDGIDRRNKQVTKFLSNALTEEEFQDYQHFVKTKAKLALELQEIHDKIAMSKDQLSALRGSMFPRGFSSLTGSPASIGRVDTSLNSSTQST